MKKLIVLFTLAALALLPATAMGDVFTFNPYTSPGVHTSISDSGSFYVGQDLFGANAYASGPYLYASGSGYSDAGIVLFFDGGLSLGDLQSVTVSGSGSPLAVNLWLDTGGNGSFFAFDGPSGYALTGLDGDSYAGCGAPPIGGSASCYMLGGVGAGGTHTLADLQAGLVAGINANTPAALWIGITNPGGSTLSATVDSITVTTVPEPASLALFGSGLFTLFLKLRKRA